jgi:hypothetical protein
MVLKAELVLGVRYPGAEVFVKRAVLRSAQILAGNTVVLKHAGNVSASALAMQKLFDDAGLPDGVLCNLFAPISATDQILAHALVRGFALTGRERAGTAVGAAAGKNLKKSNLELGGADAFIVLDDADIDKTVAWAVFGRPRPPGARSGCYRPPRRAWTAQPARHLLMDVGERRTVQIPHPRP